MDNELRRRRHHKLICMLCVIVAKVRNLSDVWIAITLGLHRRTRIVPYDRNQRMRHRLSYLNRIVNESDARCQSELRMDRQSFFNLCELLGEKGGLTATRNMPLVEIVAMFVNTLAHHKKNRTIGVNMIRSGETVSRQFHRCLQAVLRLHSDLLKSPIPIGDDYDDGKWSFFKNCLGALDGTHITINPPSEDRARYRTRKGVLTMNVLGACAPDMQFIYILSGWEGSTHDSRVLRDAISRDFSITEGCYYLVDAGYANARGFLAPYRGQRYHLKEWGVGALQPQSAEEYFNMRHARARNSIERCFGVVKKQWSILRSPCFFPIRVQSRIIYACCLLYNFIRRMKTFEEEDEEVEDSSDDDDDDDDGEREFITTVQSTDEWTNFRNSMAQEMFNDWRAGA